MFQHAQDLVIMTHARQYRPRPEDSYRIFQHEAMLNKQTAGIVTRQAKVMFLVISPLLC